MAGASSAVFVGCSRLSPDGRIKRIAGFFGPPPVV
jgi:hypothetical protein